jgi:arsenate reductase
MTLSSKSAVQPKPVTKAKVLFLCTGNSARSQMGEALLTQYAGDRYEVHSAGLAPKAAINPYTVRVMQEIGIDLADKRCTDVSEYLGRVNFGYLFTVCARTEEDCPSSFLNFGGERIDWDFEDPVRFVGNEEATLAKFREVRDQIDQRIRAWLTARGELATQ